MRKRRQLYTVGVRIRKLVSADRRRLHPCMGSGSVLFISWYFLSALVERTVWVGGQLSISTWRRE